MILAPEFRREFGDGLWKSGEFSLRQIDLQQAELSSICTGFVPTCGTRGDQRFEHGPGPRQLTAEHKKHSSLFVQLFYRNVDLGFLIRTGRTFVKLTGVYEIPLFPVKIAVRLKYLTAQRSHVVELAQLERTFQVSFRIVKFSAVNVQPGYVKVSD